SVDNFLKPYLISRGTRMPFILVFMGVVGGALTFGFIGIFIGPTLLAVGYALINEWTLKPSTETLRLRTRTGDQDATV
ncbi:MAG: AI-2E family transporter, partial [Pseudomonadota bacterium]